MPLSMGWLSFISSGREGIRDYDVVQVITHVLTLHLHSVIKARLSNHFQPSHKLTKIYLLTQVSSSKSTKQQYKSNHFATIDHVLKHLNHRATAARTSSLFG